MSKDETITLLIRAYVVLGDIANQWHGRSTPAGQKLLIDLRDVISEISGVDAKDIQDSLGTDALPKEVK